VELQQQYLGAQIAALGSLSSALPVSTAITLATSTSTSTFQYLPTEKSGLSVPDLWELDQPQASGIEFHSCEDTDQQAFPSSDHSPKAGPPHHGCPASLAKCWLTISQSARLFLHWCRESLGLLTINRCEGGLTDGAEDDFDHDNDPSWQYARPETNITPDAFQHDENVLSQIPQYILDYAPLVHLYSGEKYWPCDIGEHLYHTTPELNYTPVQASLQHPRLDNLNELNRWEYGRHMFLTSNDNVEDHPEWLLGEKNIPAAPPSRPGSHRGFSSRAAIQGIQGGRSDAPAILVVVNKGHGIVDAFWFFFYSFNLGNVVILRFGNHVGDWEHTVVRFHNGKPKAVFVSEHFFGQAYSYQAMEKIGKRPVVYSATGTHAMYATPGTHSYILPWGLLHDQTDKGPLWDPALNSHMYTYDFRNDSLRSSNFTPTAPTGWFHYAGHWGDKQYPLGDSRQYLFAGNYHYVSGPLGPKFKNLGRKKICQGQESDRCVIKNWLGGSRPRRVQRPFEEEEMAEEEYVRYQTVNGDY
jgi:hypothetical protein